MEALGTALAIVGFAAFVVGAWGVLKGGVGWARLVTRRASLAVLGAGFAAVMLAGSMLPPTEQTIATADQTVATTVQTVAPEPPPSTTTSTSTSSTSTSTSTTSTSTSTTSTTLVRTTAPAVATTVKSVVTSSPASTVQSSSGTCANGTYINTAGNEVCRPYAAADGPPAGATAQCRDGEYSFSQTRSGTCSGHGGVSRWL